MKELRYASALSIDVFSGATAARRQIESVGQPKKLQDCLSELDNVAVHKDGDAQLIAQGGKTNRAQRALYV